MEPSRLLCENGHPIELCTCKKKEGVLPSELSDLLDCPFCGGEPVMRSLKSKEIDRNRHFIHCRSCGADGGWAKNENNAINLWNQRAI